MKTLRGLFQSRYSAPKPEASQTAPVSVPYLRDKYPQYDIGEGSYGPLSVKSWNEGATLSIGKYCSFAEGTCILLGGEHRSDWITTYPFNILWQDAGHQKGHPSSKGNVTIGSDVWIGTNALILSGVSIGHGAIIGAGALVAKDIPPYSIYAGNPATLIRMRFEKAYIAALLTIQWWNWAPSRIRKALPYLQNNEIEAFVKSVQLGDL